MHVLILIAASLAFLAALAAVVFTLRTTQWGSTFEERAAAMPGDAFFNGAPRPKAVMTRAITIGESADVVWPWLAQLGRGAGWYSYDFLDNGRKPSARHIVSWIPEPRAGDACPIGYLRHLAPGSALTWWVDSVRFLGADARLAYDIRLAPSGKSLRLVTRISSDATGLFARPMLILFRFLDSIMARRQLVGIRDRVERHGARTSNPDQPETGARDQYQHYEVIYASGDRAGTPGKEAAAKSRKAAIAAGVLD